MKQRQILVGRYDVDSAGLHELALTGLDDTHGRVPLQQLRQRADMVGVEVLDNDESHATVSRDMRQEFSEGFESASGTTDADDGKIREGLHSHAPFQKMYRLHPDLTPPSTV